MKKLFTLVSCFIAFGLSAQRTPTNYYEMFAGKIISSYPGNEQGFPNQYTDVWEAPSPTYPSIYDTICNPTARYDLPYPYTITSSNLINGVDYRLPTTGYVVDSTITITVLFGIDSVTGNNYAISASTPHNIGENIYYSPDGSLFNIQTQRNFNIINLSTIPGAIVTITGFQRPIVSAIATVLGGSYTNAPINSVYSVFGTNYSNSVAGILTLTGSIALYKGFLGPLVKIDKVKSIDKLSIVSYSNADTNLLYNNFPYFSRLGQVIQGLSGGVFFHDEFYNIGMYGQFNFAEAFFFGGKPINIASNPKIMFKLTNKGSVTAGVNVEFYGYNSRLNFTVAGGSTLFVNSTVPGTSVSDLQFRFNHYGTLADSANLEIDDLTLGYSKATALTLETGIVDDVDFLPNTLLPTRGKGKVRVASVSPSDAVKDANYSIIESQPGVGTVKRNGDIITGSIPGILTIIGTGIGDDAVIAITVVTVFQQTIKPTLELISSIPIDGTILFNNSTYIFFQSYFSTQFGSPFFEGFNDEVKWDIQPSSEASVSNCGSVEIGGTFSGLNVFTVTAINPSVTASTTIEIYGGNFPYEISLTGEYFIDTKGGSTILTISRPPNTLGDYYTVTSLDTSIAKVNLIGNVLTVTGIKRGSSLITAKLFFLDKPYWFAYQYVYVNLAPEITVIGNNFLELGSQMPLKAIVNDRFNNKVKWTLTPPDLAFIGENDTLVSLDEGILTVIGTTYNYAHTDSLSSQLVVTISSTLATKDVLKPATFNLYPNPTNQILNVSPANQITKLTVYDVSGFAILSSKFPSFSVEGLSNGLYILAVETKEGIIRKTFLKTP